MNRAGGERGSVVEGGGGRKDISGQNDRIRGKRLIYSGVANSSNEEG